MGNPEVVERLIKEGLRSECVTTPRLEGQWSPISFAIFHGNEKMPEELSTTCRSLLDTGADTVRLHGTHRDGYWCNGCFHVSGWLKVIEHISHQIGHLWATLPLPHTSRLQLLFYV